MLVNPSNWVSYAKIILYDILHEVSNLLKIQGFFRLAKRLFMLLLRSRIEFAYLEKNIFYEDL